jgi:hypothetical protein
MILLATAAALTAGLTADAVALATGHTGWDGLGDGGAHLIVPTPHHGATGAAGARQSGPQSPRWYRSVRTVISSCPRL